MGIFLNYVLNDWLKLLIVVLTRKWVVLLTNCKWAVVNSIRIQKCGLYILTNRKWAICSLPNPSCGPTKLTRTKGFVNVVNINDSSCSDRTMSIQRPSCFFNVWSSCSSRPKQRRSCRVLLPPVAGCDAAEVSPPCTTPTAGQAIPLLTHTPCYSAATAASHHSQTSEPSYSSPRGLPLLRLPRLRVVPFLGLAVIHRPGALGAAWSTWSRNDFHRKSTVHGEADSWVQAAARKCLLITREIIIPPPDSRDPPDGPPYS